MKWWIIYNRDEQRMDFKGPFDSRDEAEAEAFAIVLQSPELAGHFEVVEGGETSP